LHVEYIRKANTSPKLNNRLRYRRRSIYGVHRNS